MSDVIVRDKAEYHARTTEQMERHLAVFTGKEPFACNNACLLSRPRRLYRNGYPA